MSDSLRYLHCQNWSDSQATKTTHVRRLRALWAGTQVESEGWLYWLNMKYDINGHTSNILSFVVEHAVRSGHRWLEASPSSLHHELSGGIAHSPCQHNLKGLLDDWIVLFRVNITLFINLIETKVSLKESLKSHQDGWYDQIL